MQFFLPMIPSSHEAEHVDRIGKTTKAKQPATILLMEDDDDMLQLLEEIVEGFGYRTVTVSDGDEGVAACENGTRIDLVITDVEMPIMDGVSAIHAIRAVHPGMPCIYMTGFSDTVAKLEKSEVVMMKPFDIIKLSSEIDRLLKGCYMGDLSQQSE